MIGDSEGNQFQTPFDHAAHDGVIHPPVPADKMIWDPSVLPGMQSTMPPGSPQMAAGALNVNLGTQVAPLNKNVNLALSHPDVSNALSNLQVNREHDVPYIAGPSNKGDTLYVDKSVPKEMTVGDKTFDPAVPLAIHEFTERHVLNTLTKKGMTDNKAYEIAHHEYAEPAEDAWYRANGIDVASVNKEWDKLDRHTEQETSEDKNYPKDLFKKPYEHGKVHGMKHEESGADAEWATNTKVAAANEIPYEKYLEGVHPARIPTGDSRHILNPDPTIQHGIGGAGSKAPEFLHSPAVMFQGKPYLGGDHGEAYRNVFKETGTRPMFRDSDQGFVTSTGRFVSRHEAVSIGEGAGQITPTKDLTSMGKKVREQFGLTSEELP